MRRVAQCTAYASLVLAIALDLHAARVILSGDVSRSLFYYFSINCNGFQTPPNELLSVEPRKYLGGRRSGT